jgi:hypothetical protein
LLKPSSKLPEALTIGEDSKKEFYVKDLTNEKVGTLREALDVLGIGETNRQMMLSTLNH